MNRQQSLVVGLGIVLAPLLIASAQNPYIGFVYPAGGQTGSTVRVTLGAQGTEGISRVVVSGEGLQANIVENNKRMNNQQIQLLNEQLKELRNLPPGTKPDPSRTNLVARIERLVRDHVNQPACISIANLIVADIAIAPDAAVGQREIRIVTSKGISNPLVFMVGELPEICAPPLPTSPLVTLGKEAQSRRKKQPAAMPVSGGGEMMMASMTGSHDATNDVYSPQVRIALPCTLNGQTEQGAVDIYRFEASKGQKLVFIVQARSLIPYIADAVPGWFQPVLAIRNATGKEVAYDDDYRFSPDPVLLFEVPDDGDYTLSIYDAIYRGREDFVYRISAGELPFVTAIFPLGGPAGRDASIEMTGWNIDRTRVETPSSAMIPDTIPIAIRGKSGFLSNRAPFAVSPIPDCREQEPNNQRRTAQRIALPVMVNGRIDKPGDRDVFEFEGRAGMEIVAEVMARRLNSPLDSVLKLSDSEGTSLAVNDDSEDAGSGLNTHHADSYLRATLRAAGRYTLQIADTQHGGGWEYGYRLRVSEPQAEFSLRAVPSGISMRTNLSATVSVHLIRKDGFANPVKLTLKDPPPGIDLVGSTFTGTQAVAKVTVKCKSGEPGAMFALNIIGTATNGAETIIRDAVPAEDRMQAFLWRHLVPAQELKAVILENPKAASSSGK
jgi:hypothetical protein